MAKTVEIAGAGLAGLCAAARFSQLGWKVALHERAADLRMFGAGIWLWESGLKTLAVLGAFDQATARARAIREWRIVDGNGTVLMTRRMTETDRMALPPRADLYKALIDRCVANGVEIITSSEVTEVRPDGTLTCKDGAARRADLVIIANGAYSVLREQILATAWMDFGIEAGIRMMIDSRKEDATDVITEYWKENWRLLYNPCTNGENYIFLSAPVGDERARKVPVDRALWAAKFPAAADQIERFAEAGRWDRLACVRCRRWSEGRVVVVGDAAHSMPPNLGQAANIAFNNVMALALAMDAATDIPSALRDWEARQRPLTDHVQWWSHLYGFVLGKWPASLEGLRSGGLRALARTRWFDTGLNRGARHIPAGYPRETV